MYKIDFICASFHCIVVCGRLLVGSFGQRSLLVELRCDLDVIGYRGRFDSSWVSVFVDIPIVNDAEALLQD